MGLGRALAAVGACVVVSAFGLGVHVAPPASSLPAYPFVHHDTIAAGDRHACAVGRNAGVTCWGSNDHGQVGAGAPGGTFGATATPTLVPGLTDVVALASGEAHTCALLRAGTVRCWGWNGLGQLGDGSTTDSATPVAVAITDVVEISLGATHSCALRADDSVWCWGLDVRRVTFGEGQPPPSNPLPTVQDGLGPVDAISSGDHHDCALRRDGRVACWGSNGSGQVAFGGSSLIATPTVVPEISDAVTIRAGDDHTCAIDAHGRVWCWGSGSSGQLGTGTTPVSGAVHVVALVGATDLALGARHSCASTTMQRLWCWGSNDHGQLGSDNIVTTAVPTIVAGVASIAITAGTDFTCVMTPTASVQCFGNDQYRTIGRSRSFSSLYPSRVQQLDVPATSVSAGTTHSCARLVAGWIECWGSDGLGQLGVGGLAVPSGTPQRVSGPGSASFVDAGTGHTCAIDGGLGGEAHGWCWGLNSSGQVGPGVSTTFQLTPVLVGSVPHLTDVSAGGAHSCARASDATTWCWGFGNDGRLGAGPAVGPGPVAVTGMVNTAMVSAGGYHTCALDTAHTAWCWGQNSFGQLGDGTTNAATTRTMVVGLANNGATAVSSGLSHTCLVTLGSVAMCFGSNSSGQLGDGTTAQRAAPMSVSGLPAVTDVSAGSFHSCAILADTTVRCWGANESGELGDGTTTSSTVPVAVPGLTGVVSISAGARHSCAVTEDGSVWCWGDGYWGQLGNGTSGFVTTPTEVIDIAPGATPVDVLVPVTPLRVLETRPDYGQTGYSSNKPTAGQIITLTLGPDQGIPTIALTLTATRTETPGYITTWPCDKQQPNTSDFNTTPNLNTSGTVITNLSNNNTICIYTYSTTDLIADVHAYG